MTGSGDMRPAGHPGGLPFEALAPGASIARLRELARLMREADEAYNASQDDDDAQDAALMAFSDTAEKLMLLLATLEARGLLREAEDFLTLSYRG
jgi:hypothetical protein